MLFVLLCYCVLTPCDAYVRCALRLCPGNRGLMVAHGALRSLCDLSTHRSESASTSAALALARIAITTDPHAIAHDLLHAMLTPILKLIPKATHELYQFEATLALTNLVSCEEAVAQAAMRGGAWYEMISLLGAENLRLQRAALQCMCNLVTCEKAVLRSVPFWLPLCLLVRGCLVSAMCHADLACCVGCAQRLARKTSVCL